MTATPHPFDPPAGRELRRLVIDYPLAWVCCGSGESFRATLLPLRPADSGGEAPSILLGHFPRRNPQVEALRRDPRAWLLFLGPHAYVSPAWMGDRRQTPTWNYASVQFRADIEFVDDAAELEVHLRDLAGAMEAGRPAPWSIDEMGERYARLAPRIIAFRAHVRETRARYKLGQDERDDVYAAIVAGLRETGSADLAEWMARSNVRRRG